MKQLSTTELSKLRVVELRELVKKEMARTSADPIKGLWKMHKADLINLLQTITLTRVSMAEAVAFRSKAAAEGKIPPMLTMIVKQQQFVPAIQVDGYVRIADMQLEEDVEAVNCLVVINGLTPASSYYNKFATNSGQTVRNAFPVMQVTGLLKVELSTGGVSYSQTDKKMYVNTVSMAVELGGEHCHPDLYMIEEEAYFKRNSDVLEKKNLRHFEAFIGSNSQVRAGDAMYVDSRVGVAEFSRRMGFRPEAHYTRTQSHTLIDVNKAGKRVHQPASASKDIPVFDGFTYEETKERTLTSEIVDPDGTQHPDKTAKISSFRKELPGGRFERRIIGHFPEFEVEMYVSLLAPHFKLDGQIGVERLELERIIRDAMDGAGFMSAELAEKLKIGKASKQFRALYVDKGFLIVVPELRERLGVDIAIFKGSTKGDPMPHMENNELHFSILTEAREAKEHEAIKLSRQVLNAILNAPMAKGLVAETKVEIERLMTFDEAALKQYIGYQGFEAPDETTDVDGEKMISATEDEIKKEIDNLTLYLIEADKQLALGSAAVNNKLLNLVKSTLKAIRRGQALIVKETSVKHMTVDPHTIIGFLEQGKYGIRSDSHPNVGIAKDHAMMVEWKNGKLEACAEEALLFRFPFLHPFEAQRVNKNQSEPWGGSETMRYYQKWARKGYFQGLICYSLWDMHAEAQSGADFDGDQTVVCKNRHVLDNFQDADAYFLDYTLVEGPEKSVLIAGCPFEEQFALDLKDYIPEELWAFVERYDIHFSDKKGARNKGTIVRFPSSLEGNATLESVLMHAMSRLNLMQLRKNDIGRFTNLQATVNSFAQECEAAALQLNRLAAYLIKEVGLSKDSVEVQALQADHAKLLKEALGHKRLSFLFAIAIRWEIDAAKHGGAYRQQMPFLAAFKKYKISERAVREELRLLEDRYGISLQTLIIGNAA